MTLEETIIIFDKAYWLSQPPEVRVLEINTTPDQDKRMAIGVPLALKGFKIDEHIMLEGLDPYKIMKMRMDFGYTWVPNALQPNIQISPGLTVPGSSLIPYDPSNPPGGAIKVSINLVDYPPFDPPSIISKPVVSANYVGSNVYMNIYNVILGDHTPAGTQVVDTRGTFIKRMTPSLAEGIFMAYYEKVG